MLRIVKAIVLVLVVLMNLVNSSPIFESNPLSTFFQPDPKLAESHIEKIPSKKSARLEEKPEETNTPDDTLPTDQPTFVEQKVEKIIHKLVTLSQLASSFRERLSERDHVFEYTTGNKDREELDDEGDRISFEGYFPDDGISRDNEQKDMLLTTKTNSTRIEVEMPKNISSRENDSEILSINEILIKNSKLILNDTIDENDNEVNSTIVKEDGFKIDLNEDREGETETEMEDTRPYYQRISGQIGTFVLELFASVVGLAVGAISQINHAFHQSNNTILETIYNKTH